MTDRTTISKILAPEEIRPGRFVSVLTQVCEHLPGCFAVDATFSATEPLRMRWLPDEGDLPMKVVDVCLPFVLAERADGTHRVIDVRRHQIAVVSKRFGRKAFERFNPKSPERSCAASRE